MHGDKICRAKERLLDLGLGRIEEFRGLTESEITSLEESLGVRLPAAYREFLSEMGRSAGRLFLGSDAFYPTLRKLRGWANEMLRECSSQFELPNDAVIILIHQAYVFLFFRTSDGDDPPIYRFAERDELPTMVDQSFSDFLMVSVNACASMNGT
jgi:hypothetical protein